MPTARFGLGAGVVNGVLYAVGGTTGSCAGLSAVEAYDPAIGTWTTKAPMPTGRYRPAIGVVGGILYAAGGGANCGQSFATLEAYDAATNTWSIKAPMPAARDCAGLGVVNGIIYLVGGCDAATRQAVATVEAYDPATNSWSTRAPMPTAREVHAVGVINGILYAVGGIGTTTAVATVEAYDPATDTWTTKSALPLPRYFLSAGAVNGILYAVGGYVAGGPVGTVDAYDPATDTWTEVASMPTARGELAAGVAAGTLNAVGGWHGGPLATLEAFTPAPVGKTEQTISFSALTDRTFGDPPLAIGASASSGLPVTFTASGSCTVAGSTVSLTGAGACTITADQAGDASFNPAPSIAQGFTIAKAAPVIAWNPPVSMVYSAALGSAQLNATATGVGGASLSGAFSYSPPAGTVLNPGPQALAVSFTPDDQADYTGATQSASIAVLYNTTVGHAALEPINLPPQPQSAFRIGSTIPVKFQLFLADGVTPVSSAVATIQVNKVSNGVPSTINQDVVSTVPNQGINFRYDPGSQQYIFNLSTRSWTAGSYLITASLDDGSQITAVVGAR